MSKSGDENNRRIRYGIEFVQSFKVIERDMPIFEHLSPSQPRLPDQQEMCDEVTVISSKRLRSKLPNFQLTW